uniref:Uncharacterized protein n=1 Tax=Anguilla anguilla TaxID=7936 RepID=A0A0E9RP19_ANGAN
MLFFSTSLGKDSSWSRREKVISVISQFRWTPSHTGQ